MYEVQKVELPESELGSERCFRIEYSGHGDIFIATWNGSLDLDPFTSDGESTRFRFAHGSEVLILASFAGYLKRLGKSEEEICAAMHIAGEDILNDDAESLHHYRSIRQHSIDRIAKGEPFTRFDIPEKDLVCLIMPIPSQPGVVEEVGGTGIYTRNFEDAKIFLVLAGFVPTINSDGQKVTEMNRSAEFCEHDMPAMARLVCKLALGEYRRDIHSFLINLYTPEEL